MSGKVMTPDAIVGRLESGMTLGIGGWGSRRKPMALVRALLRSDVRDLTVEGTDLTLHLKSGRFETNIKGIDADEFPAIQAAGERPTTRIAQNVLRRALAEVTFAAASEKPVFMVESGPAAGVMAAAWLGESLGYPNVLSFDMGGTTAKLSLVNGGEPLVAYGFEAARQKRFIEGSGLPIRLSTKTHPSKSPMPGPKGSMNGSTAGGSFFFPRLSM